MNKLSTVILENEIINNTKIDSIKKNKIVTLNLLNINLKDLSMNIEFTINQLLDKLPNIKIIIINPPKEFSYLEYFLYKDKKYILNIIEQIKKLSTKYNIQINLNLKINFDIDIQKKIIFLKIKELLNMIKGYNVFLLLENTINGDKLTPLNICRIINDSNLYMTLNYENLTKEANYYNLPALSYIKNNFKENDLMKYIYLVKQKHNNVFKLELCDIIVENL